MIRLIKRIQRVNEKENEFTTLFDKNSTTIKRKEEFFYFFYSHNYRTNKQTKKLAKTFLACFDSKRMIINS